MDAAGLRRWDQTATCQLHGLGNSSCRPRLPGQGCRSQDPNGFLISFLLSSHAFSPCAGVWGPQGSK